MRAVLRALFRVFFGYRAFGREHVPPEGPLILAANHHSYLDPMLAAIGQDRPLRFMAWSALFRRPWFAALIRSLGAFPVRVDAWDGAAWRTALEWLRAGGALVIFPEGARSPTEALQPLKPGVALLAMRARAPVVPVRIEGSFDAWPRHRRLPRLFRRCRVRYGPPLPPPSAAGDWPPDGGGAIRKSVQPWLERLREELERPIRETNHPVDRG